MATATRAKEDKTLFYAAVCLAAAFFILAAGMGAKAQQNEFKTELHMHLRVSGGVLGFNVSNALEFGSIPTGGGGRKTVFITNTLETTKKAELRAYGQMAEWISLSRNSFPIAAGKTENVSVYAIVPPGTPQGDYYGTMEIRLE
ncbi:hypothetical protein J4220_01125 [Candidatus Micrarchaeota archaeon]|nr:hypothetical protein [Candidatus Micrarchaeota archaeon]